MNATINIAQTKGLLYAFKNYFDIYNNWETSIPLMLVQ